MASLVELRVLEGPNLYFPRAAIKLTLNISALSGVSEETAARFAKRIAPPIAASIPGLVDMALKRGLGLDHPTDVR